MDSFITISKALSDPNRVRAFLALRNGELCACQIIELLGLAPSTVSKHMSILKQAGLVDCRKEERWMYYRLSDSTKNSLIQNAFTWITDTLKEDAVICNDQKRMKTIKRQNASSLCKNQRNKGNENG